MTINELLAKHNFITKILFKDEDSQLSKDLRIKIMAMRIEFGKLRKAYESDMKEFADEIITDRYKELANKERNEDEEKEFVDLTASINSDYEAYNIKKLAEEVAVKEDSFTEEEYEEIVSTNSGNNITINGNDIPAPDFLEIVYELFVK